MSHYSYFYKASQRVKVFISFDYDHDVDLKNLLVGQAKNEDSPFEITDISVKKNWLVIGKKKYDRELEK
jgi:hypothetical protein